MAGQLKPYPAYKNSGVEWLGEVPEHWDLMRIKTLFCERSEKGFPDEPLLAATQTKGVVRKEEYENRTVLALKDLHLLKLVCINDFVISLRSFQGGIEYAREQGIISPAYTIFFLNKQEYHGYFSFLFKSKVFIFNLSLFVTGIRQGQNIDFVKLRRSKVPLPLLPEQTAIIRYLNCINRRIKRYINSKERLIKLLEEQKQAVIHQAVTGQIDVRTGKPYPKYKDSGVEWLGKVPEGWEVIPIKRIFDSMEYGVSESSVDNGNIQLLTMGNVKNGIVTVPDDGGLKEVDSFYLLKPGDLLFNRTNSKDLVGKVGIFSGAEVPVTFASYLVRMRTNQDYFPSYINMLLNDGPFLSYIRSESIPSLHQSNLNPTRYGRLHVVMPNRELQCKIYAILQEDIGKIEIMIRDIKSQISLMKEYRTRLIADVVTGKVDVREIAEGLPEEPIPEEAEVS